MTEPEKIRSNVDEGLMDKPITIKAGATHCGQILKTLARPSARSLSAAKS